MCLFQGFVGETQKLSLFYGKSSASIQIQRKSFSFQSKFEGNPMILIKFKNKSFNFIQTEEILTLFNCKASSNLRNQETKKPRNEETKKSGNQETKN